VDADFNVAMTGGGFVELQGTAEYDAFDHQATDVILNPASKGVRERLKAQ